MTSAQSQPAPAAGGGATGTAATGPLAWLARALRAADRRVQRLEVAACVAALGLMIALAFAQVFLRTFRTETLQPVGWFDNVARHLVIWVGMLGASLATAEARHIAIEAAPKLLGPAGRRRLDVVVNVFAAGVTALLLALSLIHLLRIQVPNESHLFEVEALGLTVYRWPFLVVVPFGLAMMTGRFLLRALEGVALDDAAFEAAIVPPADGAAASAEAPPRVAGAAGAGPALAPTQEAGPPPPVGASAQAPGRAEPRPGRTTDEVPIYRDLAEDEDLAEPELRRGGRKRDDSGDLLEPAPEVGADTVDDDDAPPGARASSDDGASDERELGPGPRGLEPDPAALEDAVEALADQSRRQRVETQDDLGEPEPGGGAADAGADDGPGAGAPPAGRGEGDA